MKRLIAKSETVDLNELIQDCRDFNNWITPDRASLEQEYNVEYKNHIIYDFGDIWPTLDDFLEVADKGEIISLTQQEDDEIKNRSYTTNVDELINLLKSYRSWPQYRNMDTLQGIIEGFSNNSPMTMPIILNRQGYKWIMSGNTRLDIAFMMQVQPKVLMINI